MKVRNLYSLLQSLNFTYIQAQKLTFLYNQMSAIA
jgi:hypothetical protein